jgi:ribosomal protein S18 acetylase RimI-like enzyme
MVYRLCTPEDFDELYAIEEACFKPPYRFSRSYMRQLVDSAATATWIAESNKRMTGFAIVGWTTTSTGIVAYIQTIEVTPEQRGQGLGGELLRRVEGSANAEGADEIWLHVDARNAAAIRLYRVNGYQSAGREEHYYARGRAAEIYRKSLQTKPLA